MILFSLLACSQAPTAAITPPAAGPKPDVVIVTLDTTRADRVGAYGYAKARTDTIDRLAKDGIRFDMAISPLPLTIPAHASMFTGLFPFHHGIRSNGDNVLKDEFTTLAEHLKGAGYATAASVVNSSASTLSPLERMPWWYGKSPVNMLACAGMVSGSGEIAMSKRMPSFARRSIVSVRALA